MQQGAVFSIPRPVPVDMAQLQSLTELPQKEWPSYLEYDIPGPRWRETAVIATIAGAGIGAVLTGMGETARPGAPERR